jgi:acetylglutamate kinase
MSHGEIPGSLGFVGYLTGMNIAFIESLWRERLIPVAPCLGLGSDNELYNINADHMAAACAEFLGADQLIYLTDVAGVLDGEKVLSAITCEEIERLVQCRVVSGGMILKLEAAKRALEGGVREVRIVGGAAQDALLLAFHSAESGAEERSSTIPGTRVLREPLSNAHAALSAA